MSDDGQRVVNECPVCVAGGYSGCTACNPGNWRPRVSAAEWAARTTHLVPPFAPQDAAERLRALGWVCVKPGQVVGAVAGPTTVAGKRAEQANGVAYGCHVELEDGQEADGCVKDYGCDGDCVHAPRHKSREGCPFWRRKTAARPAGATP